MLRAAAQRSRTDDLGPGFFFLLSVTIREQGVNSLELLNDGPSPSQEWLAVVGRDRRSPLLFGVERCMFLICLAPESFITRNRNRQAPMGVPWLWRPGNAIGWLETRPDPAGPRISRDDAEGRAAIDTLCQVLQENSRKNPTLFQRLAARLPLILRFVGARHAYQQGETHDY